MRICSEADCDRKHYGRGYCLRHYRRLKYAGGLPNLPPKNPSECLVEGCGRKPRARGLCGPHRRREVRHGDPTAGIAYRPPGLDLAGVFQHFVGAGPWGSDCVEWPGTRAVNGYGVFSLKNAKWNAHRASYVLHVGPISEGMVVRHRCDNPPCVNPGHLEVGSDADNIRDAMSRRRHIYGERVTCHKLTEQDVRDVRRRHSEGELVGHLATEYGVWHSTMKSAIEGKNWKHVTD